MASRSITTWPWSRDPGGDLRTVRLGHALDTLASVVGIGGVIGPVLAGPLLQTATPALLVGCAISALAAVAALTGRANSQLA